MLAGEEERTEFGDSLFSTPPESLNSKQEDVSVAFSPPPPPKHDMGVNFSSVAHGDLLKDLRVSVRTSPNGSSEKRNSVFSQYTTPTVPSSPPPPPPQRAPVSPPIPPTAMSLSQPPKTPSKKQKALPQVPPQPSTSPSRRTSVSMALSAQPSRPTFNYPSAPVPIPGPHSAVMMGPSAKGGNNNLTMTAGSNKPRIFAAMEGAGASGNPIYHNATGVDQAFSPSTSFRQNGLAPEKAYPSPPAERIRASPPPRPSSRQNSVYSAQAIPQQPQPGTPHRAPSSPHHHQQYQQQPQYQQHQYQQPQQQQGRELNTAGE
ncbi:hypothetical protein D9756_006934 [Leucocoprinus leucothites]|uniref:Uncharacterized protein n=1 Tax=Leucocoprinus leucothites TaxID=201217 RepID=A0A8H5D847_9AGAR|nr:hypothetical protein D9756_006934 [Leucoagaricus leucothites]